MDLALSNQPSSKPGRGCLYCTATNVLRKGMNPSLLPQYQANRRDWVLRKTELKPSVLSLEKIR